MGIIKLRVRLKTRMKQKKKKKWMTVPTRQKRNQPQILNHMKTLTQIKMSQAGKSAQFEASLESFVHYCQFVNTLDDFFVSGGSMGFTYV